MTKTKLRNDARLIARTGANIQKGQDVLLYADLDQPEFVKILVEECYKAGARRVQLEWQFEPLEKLHARYQSEETLGETRSWEKAKLQHMVDTLPARIYLESADPDGLAGIEQPKYTNAMPLYRIAQEFERYDVAISRQTMSNWVIRCAERYLSLVCDKMREQLCQRHTIQADETTVKVSKDGRAAGSESYMWVYRSGEYDCEAPIIFYEYQKTRGAKHPQEFLKEFSGALVCDGYSAYHKLGKENSKIQIANCWAHARRRFSNAQKALKGPNKQSAKKTLAHKALILIGQIYAMDEKGADLSGAARTEYRQREVAPLVEAYFAWVKEHRDHVPAKSETGEGFTYSLNQEAYLKAFLTDGSIPLDNSASERAIRPFTVGRKNWMMIDTEHGAKASAMIYSLVETAKANHLKPYEYLKHLLTEIPKHMDDTNTDFLANLLPWSENLPADCRKTTTK